MKDAVIRTVLDRHWLAADANDFSTEHEIYHEDAVLEYPQSARANLRPSKKSSLS